MVDKGTSAPIPEDLESLEGVTITVYHSPDYAHRGDEAARTCLGETFPRLVLRSDHVPGVAPTETPLLAAAAIFNGVHYAGANQAALPLIDAGIRQDPAPGVPAGSYPGFCRSKKAQITAGPFGSLGVGPRSRG